MGTRPDFRALFDAHVVYVWDTLGRLGVPATDRDDAVQEVFVTVHDLLCDYDPARPFKPWLFAIAYRVALRHRRKAHRRREDVELPTELASKAGGVDGENAREARQLVQIALESIDIDRRAVFLMKELDGHDVPEIAEALGIPLNTAYSRLRVAREEFRAAVDRLERAASRAAEHRGASA